MKSALLKQIRRERKTIAGRTGRTIVPDDCVGFAKMCGITPDGWQQDLLRSKSKRILINASRQSGKSITTSILALHQALRHPGSLVLLLAPALRQSMELFAKVHEFYSVLGSPLKAYGERRLSLELSNGSRIQTLPGTEKTVRGFSAPALIILDEAARIEDGLLYSLKPMLAVSDGRLLMLSTPYGKRGSFYELWEDAGTEWQRFEIPASSCPRITPEFLESERQSMPWIWWRQEYFCEFLETDTQFFSETTIQKLFDVNEDDDVPVVLFD